MKVGAKKSCTFWAQILANTRLIFFFTRNKRYLCCDFNILVHFRTVPLPLIHMFLHTPSISSFLLWQTHYIPSLFPHIVDSLMASIKLFSYLFFLLFKDLRSFCYSWNLTPQAAAVCFTLSQFFHILPFNLMHMHYFAVFRLILVHHHLSLCAHGIRVEVEGGGRL